MGGSEVINAESNQQAPKKVVSDKKKSKAKGYHNKRRFQLFDPSDKSALIGLCDDNGLIELNLEDNGSSAETDEHNDNSNELSLDFEAESSEDEVENLPIDDDKNNGNDKVTVKTAAGLFCGSCNVKFSDLSEQRLHNTLDWHRYNIKRKVHGQDSVTEGKFDDMIDDLSSIEGSDNEEEDATGVQQVNRLLEKLSTSNSNQQQAPVQQKCLSRSQKLEKSPKMFFQNSKGQVLACFKTIVSAHIPENEEVEDISSRKFIYFIKNPMKITIIMASGGHFAAAMFEGNSCTHHKTFHSYTIRAKQGGSQVTYDAKSATSHAKSAGASLRRYNQQSFTQHVQDLMGSWTKNMAESHLVFYKAISANANILFSGKSPPLNKDSKKLKTIPFPTKRPTFSEVKRVHSLLTTVHLYDSMESFIAAHSHIVKDVGSNEKSPNTPSKRKSKKTFNRAKSRSPKRKDELIIHEDSQSDDNADEHGSSQLEEVDQIVDFNELKEYDDSLTPEQRREGKNQKKKSKNKVPKTFRPEGILGDLNDALQQQKNVESFKILLGQVKEAGQCADLNLPVDLQSSTLLHIASKSSQLDILWDLLEAGCDPSIKDKSGKYPYNYAESKECREVFRKFMGENPDKYDYKKAQVPPPLSEEMEKERAEKKKLLNKIKREKEKQKKAEKKGKEKETEEQRRFLNLSDREKRALAAEQRILAQCKKNAEKAPILVRCFECATDITGKVPFEYNQNVFCTTKCLAAHRKKFPCPLSV